MAKRNGKQLPAPSLIAVEPGKRYQVRSDGPFVVVAIEGDSRFVIGPDNESARWFAFTAWSGQIAVLPKNADQQYAVSFAHPCEPEQLDPIPIEVPVHGRVRPATMAELVAEEVRHQMEAQGRSRPESPQEADDFETDDLDAPVSGYEDDLEELYDPFTAEPKTPQAPPEKPSSPEGNEPEQPGKPTPTPSTGTAAAQ